MNWVHICGATSDRATESSLRWQPSFIWKPIAQVTTFMFGCSKTIIHLDAHCPGYNLHVWLFQNHHSFGCPLPRLQPSCLAVPKPSFIWMPIAQVTTFMFGCSKTIIHLDAHCPGYNLHVWLFQNHHSFGCPLPWLQPSCLAVPKPSFIWKPIAQVTTFMFGCSKIILHLEAHCPGYNLHVWLFQNHHSFGSPLPRLQPSCLAVPKPSFIWIPIAQVTTFMFGCSKTIIHLEAHCPGYNLHVWLFQNHHSFGSPLPRLQPSCLAVPKPSFIWKPIAQVTTFMFGCSKTIIHLEAHCPGYNLHVWLFQNHHSFGSPLPRLQPSCLDVPKPSFIWIPIAQVTTFMFGCSKTIIHLDAHCPGYNLHVWMFQNHHSFGSPLPR